MVRFTSKPVVLRNAAADISTLLLKILSEVERVDECEEALFAGAWNELRAVVRKRRWLSSVRLLAVRRPPSVIAESSLSGYGALLMLHQEVNDPKYIDDIISELTDKAKVLDEWYKQQDIRTFSPTEQVISYVVTFASELEHYVDPASQNTNGLANNAIEGTEKLTVVHTEHRRSSAAADPPRQAPDKKSPATQPVARQQSTPVAAAWDSLDTSAIRLALADVRERVIVWANEQSKLQKTCETMRNEVVRSLMRIVEDRDHRTRDTQLALFRRIHKIKSSRPHMTAFVASLKEAAYMH
ncbi:hypothetical protein K488DRAFT_73201 [Vararia minispora EC-137]|uniref:Uncharacterized protein n=1 Tax=Vararia minispora EC-137 TaxID=1314806 RepID=A0ACB8QBU4_9AGAM|nr:hypothetical protein K488DRAFT_73201 [Vararia minispora EC-137]